MAQLSSSPAPSPTIRKSAAEAGAEVFLSPRVVDKAAFDDFAAALRDLVDRAASHADPLREVTERAERTLTLIREAAARQQSRLDLALKTLAALEERSAHVERMLQRAADLADIVERFGDQADHIMTAKLSEFATRVQSESQSAAGRLAVLEERLAQTEAEAARRLDRIVERLGLRPERDENGEPTFDLPGLVKRAEVAHSTAAAAAYRLETACESAEARSRQLAESAERAAAAAEEARARHESLDAELRQSVALCREADEAIRTRAETLRALTETPLAELKARVDETVDTLKATIEHAERSCELGYQVLSRQLTAVSELRSLLSAVEPWRPLLLDHAADRADQSPPPLPPQLEQVVAAVRARLASDLGALAGALGTLAAEAGRAATGLTDPSRAPQMADSSPTA
jgi:predicted phage tail protein